MNGLFGKIFIGLMLSGTALSAGVVRDRMAAQRLNAPASEEQQVQVQETDYLSLALAAMQKQLEKSMSKVLTPEEITYAINEILKQILTGPDAEINAIKATFQSNYYDDLPDDAEALKGKCDDVTQYSAAVLYAMNTLKRSSEEAYNHYCKPGCDEFDGVMQRQNDVAHFLNNLAVELKKRIQKLQQPLTRSGLTQVGSGAPVDQELATRFVKKAAVDVDDSRVNQASFEAARAKMPKPQPEPVVQPLVSNHANFTNFSIDPFDYLISFGLNKAGELGGPNEARLRKLIDNEQSITDNYAQILRTISTMSKSQKMDSLVAQRGNKDAQQRQKELDALNAASSFIPVPKTVDELCAAIDSCATPKATREKIINFAAEPNVIKAAIKTLTEGKKLPKVGWKVVLTAITNAVDALDFHGEGIVQAGGPPKNSSKLSLSEKAERYHRRVICRLLTGKMPLNIISGNDDPTQERAFLEWIERPDAMKWLQTDEGHAWVNRRDVMYYLGGVDYADQASLGDLRVMWEHDNGLSFAAQTPENQDSILSGTPWVADGPRRNYKWHDRSPALRAATWNKFVDLGIMNAAKRAVPAKGQQSRNVRPIREVVAPKAEQTPDFLPRSQTSHEASNFAKATSDKTAGRPGLILDQQPLRGRPVEAEQRDQSREERAPHYQASSLPRMPQMPPHNEQLPSDDLSLLEFQALQMLAAKGGKSLRKSDKAMLEALPGFMEAFSSWKETWVSPDNSTPDPSKTLQSLRRGRVVRELLP